MLRATALALSRHRWNELGYDPPFAQNYLYRFKAMVEPFVPGDDMPLAGGFPGPDERAMAGGSLAREITVGGMAGLDVLVP
ncbi:hypothetical protein [Streptomyces sp. C10]|uniref:hypothetical protein n=1 Tax=Streptomyces sp. C10 TaxID=531941 RepID=UPI003981008A